MASAINNGGFTFNAKELDDFSKVIHTMTWEDPELASLHTIDEGIKYNEQIVMSSSTGLMGKKVTGCTPNEISGVTLSEKRWTPVEEDFRLKHCSADVNQQDKLVNQMSKMNPDFYNIFEGSQSKVGAFLVASVMERFRPEILRKVWFNAKNEDTIANGGALTNGTDKGYFNTFDGLFEQIFTTAGITATHRAIIAENAGATYLLQELPAGSGKKYLRNVYRKADMRLRGDKNAQFYVTQSIYDAYMDDLEDVQNTGGGNTKITEDGQVSLFYKGKKVVPMDIWDRTIEQYYNTGTKSDIPHRIVFSTPDNLRVGTLAKSDFGTVEAFYDKYNKVNVVDGIYTIDSKIIEDYKVAVGY